MAVKEEVERIGMFEIVQQLSIVAMHDGERLPGQFELSPRTVERRADVGDGLLDVAAVVIAVAEHEVRVRRKKPHGIAILNVAAMQDHFDVAFGHDLQRVLDRRGSAMGVADDGDEHDVSL